MTDGPQYVGVADYDQHHAEAIDALRQAETFLLAVPEEVDGEVGVSKIAMRGGGVGFDAFLLMVVAGLHAATVPTFEALLRRNRQVRWAMLAATAANLVLVAWNLARLAL